MSSEVRLTPDDILVRPQETPNPMAIKFITNRPLKEQGKATLNAPEELPESLLVKDLFSVVGVKQIHLFQNTITVTHDGTLTSDDLVEQVVSVLKTRMPIHNAHISFGEDENLRSSPDRSKMSKEQREIEEILDRTIRPGLQADGGDIEIISFENNELRILYQGACGGCPSSMMGTLDAIQNILRHELGNDELMVYPI